MELPLADWTVTMRSLETLPDSYRNFLPSLRETLIARIGDHKWHIQVISEEVDPLFFNTTEEEFKNKFLCEDTCVCEGEGDCDPDDCYCTFLSPKTGLIVQYNTKTGVLEEGYLLNEIQKAAAEAGLPFDEIHIVHYGLHPEKTPAENAAEQLIALTNDPTIARRVVDSIIGTLNEHTRQGSPVILSEIQKSINKITRRG